jgi:hypothetical protein
MIDSLSSEELQFIKAIEKYKSENNKHFLSWTEVLKILKELGYKKTSKRPQPAVSAGAHGGGHGTGHHHKK